MKIQIPFSWALVLVLALLAGCVQYQAPQQTAPAATAQALSPSGDTIRVTATSLGTVLSDGQGTTLYYFARDIPASGASSCTGQCAAIWPVFSANAIVVSPPLAATDFSSFTRNDGMSQTAYRGFPLYYFQADLGAGSVNGDGVTGNWFVIRPDETVMVAQRDTLGTFLTDNTGNTLYFFAKDTPETSACTGTCLGKWPSFSVKAVSAPSLLNTADFGSLQRAEGINQTTYKGRPLYYFANDTKPGDANGQGFNNLWYVANITGAVPALPATVPTTMVTTPYSTGYGGY